MKRFLAILIGALVKLTAFAQNDIVAYEYWFDQADGPGQRYTIFVAPPSAVIDLQNVTWSHPGLSLGSHTLHVRLKESNEAWSSVVTRQFVNGPEPPYEIVAVRYWWSNCTNTLTCGDMRYKEFDVPQLEIDFDEWLEACDFPVGLTQVKFQLLDNHGQWSSVVIRQVTISATTAMGIASITPSFAPYCTGQQVTFTANPVTTNNAALPTTYSWTIPTGWTTLSAAGDSVVVIIGPSPGTIVVTGSNYCNVTATGTLIVPDVDCPEFDCLGVAGGTALPGTSCNDGDPLTLTDLWSASCACQGYDCMGVPGGTALLGTSCDDGDPLTTGDIWNAGCQCGGDPVTIDCEGVIGGPAIPGTLCDDGDPLTLGEIWNVNCQCVVPAGGEYYAYEPSVTTCSGAFLDSNGNGGPYGNNENFTTTICSDGTGPAISLQWIIFNLSTAGNLPLDQLSIYDGTSTSDPLIGTWSGNDNPGINSSSFGNITGCLTVVFTSNNVGTGEFAAAITCFQPCVPPTAVATIGGAPTPVLICQGEVINCDGSGSYAANGFTIQQWIWDFADGTIDSTSGPLVTRQFNSAGEYVVQLTVVDDNDCGSVNEVDLQVSVSSIPVFSGTTGGQTACLGDSLELVGMATTPATGPTSTFQGPIMLPDLQGVPFNAPLEITGFGTGEVLTNADQLGTLCVSMEHSYMGDLVVQLACPNGQVAVLHQQGGGATYLGIPIDDESDNMGTCWDYCWSANATNGTWVDNAGGTLPSGTYESLQPLSNLVGCPLNGTWTFTITDLFAIDNGFLCEWSMGVSTDTGSAIISGQWSGNDFVQDPNVPFAGWAVPSQAGTSDYTFTVVDDYGCTYDTTISLFTPDLTIAGLTGPTVIDVLEDVQYNVVPFLGDADTIIWTLPSGWIWSGDDADHYDQQATLVPNAVLGSFQLCAVAQGFGCTGVPWCLNTVGLNEPPYEGSVLVLLPNPSNGNMVVVRNSAEPLAVVIRDVAGHQLGSYRIVGERFPLDLSSLATGWYTLNWTHNDHIRFAAFQVVR